MLNYVSPSCTLHYTTPVTTASNSINPSLRVNTALINHLLLNTISQALKISLKNYQLYLANKQIDKPKNEEKSLSAKQKLKNPQKVIEIIISEDDQEKQNTEFCQSTYKESLKILNYTQKNASRKSLDPNKVESKIQPKLVQAKKGGQSKAKIKKSMRQNKKTRSEIALPEVDLIETAYLPPRNTVLDKMQKIREQLLLRRFMDCDEFTRSKKQRREIRMLGN